METKVTCNLLKYRYNFFGITVACCLVIMVVMSVHHLTWTVPSFQSNQRAATSYNCGPGCNVTGSTLQQHAPVVLKTVYSEHVRFVFFAGLEKTGHHFWNRALQPCKQSGICTQDRFIHRGILPKGRSNNLSTADDAAKQEDMILTRFRLLQKQCLEDGTLNKPHVGMLNVLRRWVMLSYPTGKTNRYMNNPNVMQLAALAESARVDLRIVLLVRDMAEILHSHSRMKNQVVREFLEAYGHLSNSLMNLGHQLALLDRRFIVCFDLDRYTDQTHLDTVASALISPTKFQADFGKYLRKPLLDVIRTQHNRIHAGNSLFRQEARKRLSPSQLRLLDQLSLHMQYLRRQYC